MMLEQKKRWTRLGDSVFVFVLTISVISYFDREDLVDIQFLKLKIFQKIIQTFVSIHKMKLFGFDPEFLFDYSRFTNTIDI